MGIQVTGLTVRQALLPFGWSISRCQTIVNRIGRIAGSAGSITALAVTILAATFLGSLGGLWIVSAVVVGIVGIGYGCVWSFAIVERITTFLFGKILIEPKRAICTELRQTQTLSDLLSIKWMKKVLKNSDEYAKGNLISKMNFLQLSQAQKILGSKKIGNYFSGYPQNNARIEWKLITDFKTMSPQAKLHQIDPATGNPTFHTMLSTNDLALRMIRKIANQESGNLKSRLISQLDIISGYNVPGDVVTLDTNGTKMTFKKTWIEEKCTTVGQFYGDPNVDFNDAEMSIPNYKTDDVQLCFSILKGDKDLPKGISELQSIGQVANYLGADDVIRLIADEMIERFELGQITIIELIQWIAEFVNIDELREKALEVTGLSQGLLSEAERDAFDIQTYTRNWPRLQQLCATF